MAGFVNSIETKGDPIYENNDKKQKHFLICESCFWCASSSLLFSILDPRLIKTKTISKCPLCDSGSIRAIPIFERFVS